MNRDAASPDEWASSWRIGRLTLMSSLVRRKAWPSGKTATPRWYRPCHFSAKPYLSRTDSRRWTVGLGSCTARLSSASPMGRPASSNASMRWRARSTDRFALLSLVDTSVAGSFHSLVRYSMDRFIARNTTSVKKISYFYRDIFSRFNILIFFAFFTVTPPTSSGQCPMQGFAKNRRRRDTLPAQERGSQRLPPKTRPLR